MRFLRMIWAIVLVRPLAEAPLIHLLKQQKLSSPLKSNSAVGWHVVKSVDQADSKAKLTAKNEKKFVRMSSTKGIGGCPLLLFLAN